MRDTNEMPDSMRAEFVRAFTNEFGFGVMTASANADAANMLKAASWAWQASREAVEVELPDYLDTDRLGFPAYDADQVDRAIEAQGLRVKP